MKRFLALGLLALSFSSCVVTVPSRNTGNATGTTGGGSATISYSVSFGVQVGDVIADFQPNRGGGGRYRIGENISLRLTSRENGFVTLVIYNPGDYRNAEIRNIPVQRGVNSIPNQNTLTASEPTGVTRFRAFFTPQPNDNVSFLRGYGESYLETSTAAYLNPYPVQLRDVKETFVVVSR
jgi:opacity protein-like surface antigen